MKAIAKFNRGAILTFFVLCCVAAYLIGLSIAHNAEKPAIQKLCADYIQAEVHYSMLPEQYRTAQPEMPAAEKEQYLAEMARQIKVFLIDDEATSAYTVNNLKTRLENQMRGQNIIYDYSKTVVKYDSIEFSDGIVNISVRTQTVFDGSVYNGAGNSRQKTAVELVDSLVLQKSGGQWKVIYASLNSPGNGQEDYYGREPVIYK